MSVINTNYLALVSQNNLTKSQNSLGTAIERLSSGLRINSAKDDAAGQAIANRFTANINGLTQAARNANDGISVAQTTEGALNEINENLQRIRTLTVQASTGSNSGSDLKSIQAEITQRLGEIDRISKETQFNGVHVIGEKAGSLSVQVGAHDGETIDIGLRQVNSGTLELTDFDVTVAYAADARMTAVSKVAAQGTQITGTATIDADGFAGGAAENPVAGTEIRSANGKYYVEVTNDDNSADGWYEVEVGTDGTLGDVDPTAKLTLAEVGNKVTHLPGNDVDVDFASLAIDGLAAGGSVEGVFENEAGERFVKITGATNSAGNGYYAATVGADGKVAVADWTATAGPQGVNASPLKAIDDALADVDALRSDLGAIQNRFQSTIANLNNTVNNLSAARSRIEDADYAVEVSNMTRAQILQQAGTSVLAQANQVPQTVLSLLR